MDTTERNPRHASPRPAPSHGWSSWRLLLAPRRLGRRRRPAGPLELSGPPDTALGVRSRRGRRKRLPSWRSTAGGSAGAGGSFGPGGGPLRPPARGPRGGLAPSLSSPARWRGGYKPRGGRRELYHFGSVDWSESRLRASRSAEGSWPASLRTTRQRGPLSAKRT